MAMFDPPKGQARADARDATPRLAVDQEELEQTLPRPSLIHWPLATIAMIVACALYLFLGPEPTFFQTLGTASLMVLAIAVYRENPIVTGFLFWIAFFWSLAAPASIDGDVPPIWAVVGVVTALVAALLSGVVAPLLGGLLVVIGVFAFLIITAFAARSEEIDAAAQIVALGSYS
jgi:hypothetical protein